MFARSLLAAVFTSCLSFAAAACSDAPIDAQAPSVADAAPVLQGALVRWPEAREHLLVDVADDANNAVVTLGRSRPSGIDAMWSVASTTKTSGTAFFYGDFFRTEKESRVAIAHVAHVRDIRDASKLAYENESVGPVPVGTIVVVEHAPSRRYLALALDAIEPTDPRTAGAGPYAYANVRWYLTAPGSADFGRAE